MLNLRLKLKADDKMMTTGKPMLIVYRVRCRYEVMTKVVEC